MCIHQLRCSYYIYSPILLSLTFFVFRSEISLPFLPQPYLASHLVRLLKLEAQVFQLHLAFKFADFVDIYRLEGLIGHQHQIVLEWRCHYPPTCLPNYFESLTFHVHIDAHYHHQTQTIWHFRLCSLAATSRYFLPFIKSFNDASFVLLVFCLIPILNFS